MQAGRHEQEAVLVVRAERLLAHTRFSHPGRLPGGDYRRRLLARVAVHGWPCAGRGLVQGVSLVTGAGLVQGVSLQTGAGLVQGVSLAPGRNLVTGVVLVPGRNLVTGASLATGLVPNPDRGTGPGPVPAPHSP
jgi:hypothetical protein